MVARTITILSLDAGDCNWSGAKVRCAVHNDRDAVGVCLSCGAGVCTTCRVAVAGMTYCAACLDAGRYRPPAPAPPTPESGLMVPTTLRESQARFYLGLGVMGFLIFGIAMHIMWIAPLIWVYATPIIYGGYPNPNPDPVGVGGLLLLSIGMVQVGLTFYALGRGLRSRLSQATAILSFVSAGWMPIASLFALTGLVWVRVHIYTGYSDYYTWAAGPLFVPYAITHLTGLALLGVTLIVWSSAIIGTRHLGRLRGLALAAGVLFLIAAHFVILPLPFYAMQLFIQSQYYYFLYYSAFPGILVVACLVEPATILAAILTNRVRTPK